MPLKYILFFFFIMVTTNFWFMFIQQMFVFVELFYFLRPNVGYVRMCLCVCVWVCVYVYVCVCAYKWEERRESWMEECFLSMQILFFFSCHHLGNWLSVIEVSSWLAVRECTNDKNWYLEFFSKGIIFFSPIFNKNSSSFTIVQLSLNGSNYNTKIGRASCRERV